MVNNKKISTERESQLSVTEIIRNELNSDVSSHIYKCEVATRKHCFHHVHCTSDSHISSFLTAWGREVTVIHGFQKEIKTPVRPDSY